MYVQWFEICFIKNYRGLRPWSLGSPTPNLVAAWSRTWSLCNFVLWPLYDVTHLPFHDHSFLICFAGTLEVMPFRVKSVPFCLLMTTITHLTRKWSRNHCTYALYMYKEAYVQEWTATLSFQGCVIWCIYILREGLEWLTTYNGGNTLEARK